MKNKVRNLIIMTAMVVTLTASNGLAVYAAPKTMPDGGTFDPEYYAATYPDVAAAYGNNETLLYQHYLLCGKAEGRLPYAQGAVATPVSNNVKTMPDGGKFDAAFYARTYPDVAAVLGTSEKALYAHYLSSGKLEGRLPYAPGAVKAEPKNLLDCLVTEKNGFYFRNDDTDSYGNRYFNKHMNAVARNGGNLAVFAEVSGYRYISGTIAPEAAMGKNVAFQVNIYAGNTLVYTSPLIEKYTSPINFDVAINNPSYLKIEVTGNSWDGSYLIIANTTLHD